MEKFLLVDNIKKSFGQKTVLDGISFEINKNEIVGLLGRNGSGKSTLMKIICGLQNPSSGNVRVCDFDIKKEREKVLENLGVSIENPALYTSLSGLDNLKLMATWTNSPKERIDEMVAYSGLGHKINYKVSTYSMGMKMRLMLAMVLMSKPKLIMLDEPMNGLDPDGVIELRKELEDLRDQGCAVLLSSHQLSEMEKVTDRIVMIEGGKVVLDDYIGDLKNTNTYLIKTSDKERALKELETSAYKVEPCKNPDKKDYLEVAIEGEKLEALILFLVEKKINVLDIEKSFRTLEDLYESIIS